MCYCKWWIKLDSATIYVFEPGFWEDVMVFTVCVLLFDLTLQTKDDICQTDVHIQ